ncbi:MAG TPA: hypothetical protein VMC43_01990 [Candidatus Paceibacterota bacterium]|nr:hypothetical protein [Candidatus Paceibacterota bacterium]
MRALKFVIGCLLVAAIISTQIAYDANRVKAADQPLPSLSAPAARLTDLGLHGAVASFGWASWMSDIILISDTSTKFLNELSFVNNVDPKLSFPYAFSVLVLSGMHRYSKRVSAAIEIGQRGTKDAAPDWRIPFYTATTYYLELKDRADAITYFDIAARTPGAPYYIQRFSENFGIAKRDRDATRAIWEAIYNTAKDDDTRLRAQAYLFRLDIFDLLEKAAALYKGKYGHYPNQPEDLVTEHILSEMPQDPFGFHLKIDPKTGEAGIITTE